MKFNSALFVLALLPIYCVQMEDVTELYREVCPYTSYCRTGPRLNFTALKDFAPCCTQCFCDKDCWKFQDCCPDIPNTGSDLDLQTSCMPSVVNSPALENSSKDLDAFLSYRMFNTCPRDFAGNEEIIKKCIESHIQVMPDLDDVVIVSNSRYHDEIYKNKYCAACHGVVDVVRMVFDCGTSMESACVDKPGFEVSPTIKAMCERGHYAPVTVPLFLTTRIFKNPYCALCSLDSHEINDVCSTDLLSDSRSMGTNSLTVLLNVQSPAQSDVRTDTRCAYKETFDYVTNRCRLLNCPWNSYIRFGECATFSQRVEDVKVRIKVLFRPINDLYITYEAIEYNEDQSAEFVVEILRTLKLGPCRPSIFYTNAYLDIVSNTLKFVIVNLLVILSNECTFKYLLQNQKYNAQLTFYNDISINNIKHPMTGSIYFAEPYKPYRDLDPSLFTEKSLAFYSGVNPLLYVLEEFFICPYFSMNISEYNSIMSSCSSSKSFKELTTLKSTDRVHRGFYVLSGDKIVVCIETYFRMCGAKNMAASYSINFSLCLLFWLIAYILVVMEVA